MSTLSSAISAGFDVEKIREDFPVLKQRIHGKPLVYLDSAVLPEHRLFSALKWTAIAVAAGGTVLRLRLSTDRRFVVTPLDLIVLFVALVVPNLSGSFALPDGGAGGIAKVHIVPKWNRFGCGQLG